MKRNDKNTCIRLNRDEHQIIRCKEDIQQVEDSLSAIAQVMALAGNPVRLKILYLLEAESKLCVCDLSEILEMKIPAVSQHLRKLKDTQLVVPEREGTVIHYRISQQAKPTLNTLLNLISEPVIA